MDLSQVSFSRLGFWPQCSTGAKLIICGHIWQTRSELVSVPSLGPVHPSQVQGQRVIQGKRQTPKTQLHAEGREMFKDDAGTKRWDVSRGRKGTMMGDRAAVIMGCPVSRWASTGICPLAEGQSSRP